MSYSRRKIIKAGVEEQRRKVVGGPVGWTPTDIAIEEVAIGLGRRLRKHDLYRMVYAHAGKDIGKKDIHGQWFHKCSRETCEFVIGAARVVLREQLKLPREDQMGLAISVYEDIIRDEKSTPTERSRAQERIDSILGHDAKFGEKTDAAEVIAAKLRETLKRIDDLTTGS